MHFFTHSIKIVIRQSKRKNIQNSVLCVESGYEYNREVFFFSFSSKVTDRELTLAKCKLKLLYKRSWIRG